ncbi:hypothetical protein DICPUDRAFT_160326 [Dictyostelium purpureum]|uniref:Uncharacterized protein n=1 Tax=Dictyostelium purpureum TaxID=5786 RepID=F1A653_DICPU|nr:uncharacterized protein DICPUDRAFT_160326 [Dictyostelium purpureum]EGC28329.1 hypothetical protein DICPUDRAFT_160326 [Dictyostelium purpureum]|eukprot:XP_003295147.1 hypothetical protein DICPUDRAFT_160326 [Dictyostelium purpureum]
MSIIKNILNLSFNITMKKNSNEIYTASQNSNMCDHYSNISITDAGNIKLVYTPVNNR